MALLSVKATVFQYTTSTPRLAAATSSSRIAFRYRPIGERKSSIRPITTATSAPSAA